MKPPMNADERGFDSKSSIINPKGFLFAFLSARLYNEAVKSKRWGPVRRKRTLGPEMGSVESKCEMRRCDPANGIPVRRNPS